MSHIHIVYASEDVAFVPLLSTDSRAIAEQFVQAPEELKKILLSERMSDIRLPKSQTSSEKMKKRLMCNMEAAQQCIVYY